ncbi:K+-H+ EXCHANGE-LIKE PROTEIN [Salix viminalis]|uniref:K+-H+ EXCHANGE-LIKE PROTEIN n=1 Tax=Salix viminalis TaxID=40686 RepID=A0A9Q0T7F7_SALVM|nr:K+-H+ EXCHANGE-LIKE PROTEIN [Salix viminalis]
MRARLVVFPVKGRNWCFSRSIDPSPEEIASAHTHSTLKDLWKKISSSSNSSAQNVEHFIDYASNKMNKAWTGLEKAPEGTFKNKLHGLGLMLFLNGRLVRRRLRHIATRGASIHRTCFYASVTLLPLSSALAVLPLPNIPFFWLLFRSYSNWRALKGSEKLLQLVSDCSYTDNSLVPNAEGSKPESEESKHKFHNSQVSLWVLQPSKELEELHNKHANENGLNDSGISEICKNFSLNTKDVSKV